MALVSSMLLLVVVTLLAIGMFRTLVAQEKIAGNLREKTRALHAAVTAQQYAEWWLTKDNHSAMPPVTCDGTVLNANLNQGQICSNRLTSVTNPPLLVGDAEAGVTINPGQAMTVTTRSGRDTYYKTPRFYIADLGPAADATGEVYQISAVGYGATASAVAVVESTYVVSTEVLDRSLP
jgi:type IV pilus assembly protein PilX